MPSGARAPSKTTLFSRQSAKFRGPEEIPQHRCCTCKNKYRALRDCPGLRAASYVFEGFVNDSIAFNLIICEERANAGRMSEIEAGSDRTASMRNDSDQTWPRPFPTP